MIGCFEELRSRLGLCQCLAGSRERRGAHRGGRRPLNLGLCGLLLASLSGGCQYGLIPGDAVSLAGTELHGWIEDPQAVLLVQAWDHCQGRWREVQRASVDAQSAQLYGVKGYFWRAPWSAMATPQRACLNSANAPGLQLRVVARGSDAPLPHLARDAWSCLLAGLKPGLRPASLLASCETTPNLPLTLRDPCAPGFVLSTTTLKLRVAGNVRRVGEPQGEAMMYHFKNSLLVGKAPPALGFEREFRNYLRFELPPGQAAFGGKAQGAWVSWFSNFERAPCNHREDMGCGYASQDSFEDFTLHLLDAATTPDPSAWGSGLMVQDAASVQTLFSSVQESPRVATLRMQRSDVDRWFDLPLSDVALRAINDLQPGEPLMLAGRVISLAPGSRHKRQWLFVDHLLGKSLGPTLEPRLTVAYCRPTSP